MKRFLLLSAFALGIAGGFLYSRPCIAGWCPTYRCFGSGACGSCKCISQDYSGGQCVDVQHAERLIADGAVELK